MSRYLIAALLARLADEMVSVAVVLLVLQRTGHPGLAGVVITAYTLPALVSGPLLGAWLDGTKHRRAALAANEGLLAVAAMGLVATVGHTNPVVPAALAAMAGVTLPLTSAGFTSMIPKLVPTDQLKRANTLDALSFNGAAIAGPALAGTLAAGFGPGPATAAIAAIALAGLAATLAVPVALGNNPAPERLSTWHAVAAGTRYLVRTPPLRGATITTVLGYGSVGALAVALPLFTTRLGAGPEAAGLLWAALEVGCIVGAVAVARLTPTVQPHRLVLIGTALFGATVATWPLARSVWPATVLVALAGVSQGPVLPAIFAVRQRYAPPHLLAQISTTGASMKVGAYALGAALGGALAATLGPTTMITLVAAAELVAAGVGWLAARGGLAPTGDQYTNGSSATIPVEDRRSGSTQINRSSST